MKPLSPLLGWNRDGSQGWRALVQGVAGSRRAWRAGGQWHNPSWGLSQAGQGASVPGQVCRSDGWLLGDTRGTSEAARRCEGSHGSLEPEEPLGEPGPCPLPRPPPPSQAREVITTS